MSEAEQTQQKDGAPGSPADLGRLAADMLQANPFVSNPAAAFAAATAIGFGISSRMAGAFFGALQGAVDVTSKMAAALDEHAPKVAPAEQREAVQPKADVVAKAPAAPAKPAKAKPAVARSVQPKVKPAAKVIADVAVPAKVAVAKAAPSRKAVAKADDLKLISGVGPKLEQVLNGHGVKSFAEIAAWTEADVARFDAELGVEGRIDRDDWVAQAKALAAKR